MHRHGRRRIRHPRHLATQYSIVTIDPGDGKGSRTFYVPNVDFSLDAANLAASPAGAIPDPCYGGLETHLTLTATIESALSTPEGKHPYRYRYLRLPAPVCVLDEPPAAKIAILVSLKSRANTASIPDGATVSATGIIATIDAGEQPLTLQFLADRVTRH